MSCIQTFGELATTHPEMHPPVVAGLIRRGEIMNIIADPNYEDPARTDISGREIGMWFAVNSFIVVVAIAMWIGGN